MNTSKILNFVLALCLIIVCIKFITSGNESNSSSKEDYLSISNNKEKMKTLLDTTTMGKLQLKNRFVRASVGDKTHHGELNKEATIQLYTDLAQGGVGTILSGYTIIDESEKGQNIFAMYDDKFIDDHAELTAAVHQNGANILMQLVHLGANYNAKDKDTHIALGASAVPNLQTGIVPREMTQADIDRLIQNFADAAVRAQKAGYDGVEIHGCHGYFLHQFITSYYNRRTDKYGGSMENRNRIVLEVYDAIRQAVGNDFQVWIKVQSQDAFDGGVTHEECLYLTNELAKRGIDAIEVSGNFWDFRGNEAFFKDIANQIATETGVPVIVTGGNRDFAVMEQMINETAIEYVGMARPLIQNPRMIGEYMETKK